MKFKEKTKEFLLGQIEGLKKEIESTNPYGADENYLKEKINKICKEIRYTPDLELTSFELNYNSEYSQIYQIASTQRDKVQKLINKFITNIKDNNWNFSDVIEYLTKNEIKFYESQQVDEIRFNDYMTQEQLEY